ncbi:SemiSWEET family transporter [Psittacicella gerlachiana]|uniref:SemiSWEET family transporter n=1 Tax=Psittacicella gerlachiana TaxID=2028574 RepID=UPI001FE37B3E|nr:SemiSWEET family transporter [Psittacicella gerlachiana]
MEKTFNIVGWIATFTSMLMYIAYIPQIWNSLHGVSGDFIQPLAAGINCSLWVVYGLFKPDRDLPLAVANIPGVFFGYTAAILAIINLL